MERPRRRRRSVAFVDESAESWVAFSEIALGPVIVARAELEPQGLWDEARAELVTLYETSNEATDGSLRVQAEYLMTMVELAG